jgi:hypothetical protein
MSLLHQLILLAGLIGVPVVLLIIGHRLRRSSDRRQRVFWGALCGHVVAGLVALVASITPPLGWSEADVVRGAAGVWGLLVLPLIGAGIGAFTRTGR